MFCEQLYPSLSYYNVQLKQNRKRKMAKVKFSWITISFPNPLAGMCRFLGRSYTRQLLEESQHSVRRPTAGRLDSRKLCVVGHIYNSKPKHFHSDNTLASRLPKA